MLIVVDRIDLDTQITATFNAADVPNCVAAGTRAELRQMLEQDVRKVIITTIHKFGEAPGKLNERDNIIALVDEAHRTQEGDLGLKMREALPNAFLFGLTGTPINKRDRNTFAAFGAEEDEKGYMSRYSFDESIRDGATLPLHFEARLVQHRVDQAAIDEAFANITGELSEEDLENLSSRASRLAILLKAPEHVRAAVNDIAEHFQAKVQPNGFKAQVVVFDREACVAYKAALDEILPPEWSEFVMSVGHGDDQDWRDRFGRSKDDEEKLLDRFRDPADPLQILIVTSRLLTGFDAPILQAMYLDKPMKDHNLLQAICRTNRPYQGKSHGLIVDYLGIFDDVAKSLNFDEHAVRQVISNIEELKRQLPEAMAACLDFFMGVDRTVGGYEGLIAAQERLPDNQRPTRMTLLRRCCLLAHRLDCYGAGIDDANRPVDNRLPKTSRTEGAMAAKWMLKGDALGACSCDWGCPCNFDAPPTKGWCHGGYSFHINEGDYNGTKLSGLNVGWFGNSPAALHLGNVVGLILVDEKADDAQRAAIG